MPTNPDWARDELILALDLYFRAGRKQLDARHPDVIELSTLLNQLPIHSSHFRDREFRNPNGVSMKLGNYLSLDPAYAGKGLMRGSKLEREIWNEYAPNLYRLRQVAEAIRTNYSGYVSEDRIEYEEPQEEEFPEGQLLTRLHKQRERNPRAVKRKKEDVLAATGRLACEVCSFDFNETYGTAGYGYAECHHLIPISLLNTRQPTRLSDLANVCANCHRMLHRIHPMPTIAELRELVKRKAD